jgi:hypothetical protein
VKQQRASAAGPGLYEKHRMEMIGNAGISPGRRGKAGMSYANYNTILTRGTCENFHANTILTESRLLLRLKGILFISRE